MCQLRWFKPHMRLCRRCHHLPWFSLCNACDGTAASSLCVAGNGTVTCRQRHHPAPNTAANSTVPAPAEAFSLAVHCSVRWQGLPGRGSVLSGLLNTLQFFSSTSLALGVRFQASVVKSQLTKVWWPNTESMNQSTAVFSARLMYSRK